MSSDSCLGILAYKRLCFLTSHPVKIRENGSLRPDVQKNFLAGRAINKQDLDLLESGHCHVIH